MKKLQAISSEASAEDAVSFTLFSIKPSLILHRTAKACRLIPYG
jgi:hypothetical protein